jgi:hypothetical protein
MQHDRLQLGQDESNRAPTNLECLVAQNDLLAQKIALRIDVEKAMARIQQSEEFNMTNSDKIISRRIQHDGNNLEQDMARTQQELVNNPSILAAQNEEIALKRMQHDRIGQDTTIEQAMARTQQPKLPHGITLDHALRIKLLNNPSILRHIRNIQFIQKRMLALRKTDLTRHVTPEELIMINRTNERSAAMAFLSTEEFLRYRMDEMVEEERAAAMSLLQLH